MIIWFTIGFAAGLFFMFIAQRIDKEWVSPPEHDSDVASIYLQKQGFGWVVKVVVNGVETTRIYGPNLISEVLEKEVALIKRQTKNENVKFTIKVNS